MTGFHVLVADDEKTARDELCDALKDAGFETTAVSNGKEAFEAAMKASFDVCISDIKMPEMDGLELLERLGDVSPETAVIMITAYGDMKTAIDALRNGATDYILKPFLFEDILSKVSRIAEHRGMAIELRNLRAATRGGSSESEKTELIGESPAMLQLLRMIEKVGATSSNVLITGDSGTGKELIARAIHQAGALPESPFVPINCAAIPETLLESELFGHAKGAFTGAYSNKEGLLKTAGDGTIFLDEIGDMPMSIQAKLLRAIESREIQPVGSVRTVPIQARIVAATNKNLEESIEKELFRDDLYYRLAVVELKVPSLKERRGDIPALAQHFTRKFSSEMGRPCTGIDGDAIRLLAGHDWKGNIRELQNTIERAMIFAEGETISIEDLPESIRRAAPLDPRAAASLADATARFEREQIMRAVDAFAGDKRKAAESLGLSLSSLYRKLDTRT